MKKNIKLLTLLLALILMASTMSACAKQPPAYEDIDLSTVNPANVTVSDKETDYVIIDVAEYGQIVIRLFPDVAPKTVENFKKLVSEKFYDGTIFHRVIEGFMIQGGDDDGDGIGGSKDTIVGEFSDNDFENNLKHVRGTVSMARTSNPNSASSQFFICQESYPYGDGKYAAFGFVVSGMDVVDKIAAVRVNGNNKPRTDVVMTSIRFASVH